MKELYQNRISRLTALLSSQGEAALITNEVNIGYFTGFFHSEGCLLATQNAVYLLVDFRYYEAAQKKSFGCRVICFKKLTESLCAVLSESETERVLAEATDMTVSRYNILRKVLGEKGVELAADGSLDRHIAKLRVIKDESELEKIAAAQIIAEQAYLEMLNYVRPGVSERELAARLAFYMKLRGAEDVSFDLITITGKKTSLPHGVPSDDIVREGDFLTCDFGAVYEGYHSDTTRTVAVGSADDEMRMVYSVVLKAQLAALSAVRAGVPCRNIDKTARNIIEQAGYGGCFGHSVGHGVGLNIHEAPSVSGRGEGVLEAGMVITDEPGIYLPGKFGVRIEDMLCVTETGCKNFVSLTKELIIV